MKQLQSLTVLVIEDNPGDVLLLQNALDADPLSTFKLTVEETLSAGLKRLQQAAFDVVLVDLGLPDSAGLQTFEALHRAAPELPVVVFSGNDDEQQAVDAVRAGAQDYLVKNLSGFEMAARTVRYAIERQRSQQLIRESEQRLKGFLDSAPDAMVIVNSKGRIIFANVQAEKLFWYKHEELLQQELSTLIPEQFRDTHDDHRMGYFAEPRSREMGSGLELYALRSDGSEVPVEITLSHHQMNDEAVVLSAIRDISERKKAGRELRESEQRFAKLFNSNPSAVVLVTMDGRYVDVNQAYLDLVGLTREDLLGYPDAEAESLRNEEWRMFADLSRTYGSGLRNKEMWLPVSTGHRHVLTSIETIIINGMPHRMIAINDITERKQAEEKLRESEFRYRELFENINSGVAVYEVVDGGRDFIFRDFNRAGEKIDNDQRERLIGKSIFEMRPGIAAYGLTEVFREVWQSGQPVHLPTSYYQDDHLGGWYENFIYRISPNEIVAVFDNVTERKQAEEKLAASENRFRALIERSSDGIIVLSAKGQILYESPAASRLIGFTPEERQGWSSFEKIHPDDLPMVMSKLALIASQPGRVGQVEYRGLHKDGSIWWVDVVATNLLDEPGIEGIVVNFRDITERKQVEEKLHISEERHRRAMEAAGAVPYYEAYYENAAKVRYEFIGEGIRQITGYGPEEFSATVWDSLIEESIPVEELAGYSLDDSIEKVRSGEVPIWKCEFRIRARDGSIHWVYEAAVELRDANGVIVGSIGSYQDITERKQAEQKLRESEQRYTTLFQKSGVPVVLLKLPEVTMADVNEAAEKLTGYSREELIGKTTVELGIINQNQRSESITRFEAEGKLEQNQMRITTKTGDERIVMFNTHSLKIDGQSFAFSAMQDITEQKRAEETLQANEQKLRSLVESETHFVIRFNLDGRFTYWNETYKNEFGWLHSQTDHTEADPLDSICAHHHLRARKAVEQCIAQPGQVVRVEIDKPAQDGGIRSTLWEWVCLTDKNGRPSEIQCMGIEFTERKHAEEALRQRLEDLALINELNNAVNRGEDIVEITEQLANETKRIFGSQYVSIYLVSPDKQTLNLQHFTMHREPIEKIEKLIGLPLPQINLPIGGDDHFNQVLKSDHGILFTGFDAISRWLSDFTHTTFLPAGVRLLIQKLIPTAVNQLKIHSVISIPLKAEDEVLGLIEFATEGTFDENALERLQNIRHQLAEVILRKRTEQSLQESNEKYRGLVESLDSILVVLDHEGRHQYINDIGASLFNSTPEALIGKTLKDIFPHEIAEQEITAIHKVFETDRPIMREIQIPVQGLPHWFHISYQPIHNDSGRVAQVLVNATDIHELKSAQEELAELNRTLEERVKQAVAEIQDLYDNAPAGYHSLDANGCVVQINQTELNWLGYTRVEVLGHLFTDLLTPASLATFTQNFPGFKEHGSLQELEMEFLRKDGTTFQTLVNATAIKDENGNYVMSRSTVFDITDRKKAENALKTSESKYRLLFENMTEGFSLNEVITDENGRVVDYRIMDANEAYGQHTGLQIKEVIGKTVREIITQVDPQLIETWGKVAQTGEPFAYEFFSKPLNRYLNVRAFSPQRGQFAILLEDVTERTKTEQAMRANLTRVNALYLISQGSIDLMDMQALLKLVAETLVQVLVADRVNILVMDVKNKKIEIAYKYGPGSDNVVDIPFEEAWDGLTGWALREQKVVWSPYGVPDERESQSVQQRRKETYAGDIIVVPLVFQGRPLGTITAINRPEDVGFGSEDLDLLQVIANQVAVAIEHLRAKMNLQQANIALERAMKVKDEFLASMSHELRTPLTGILGFSEAMQLGSYGELNAKQNRALSGIHQSGEHLLSLINDILDLSKIESGKLEMQFSPCSLADICQSSLQLTKGMANQKHQYVNYSAPLEPILLIADARRIKQVIVNLLSNAIKFTPEHGELGLSVESDEGNRLVRITVWDKGIGIKAENMPKLFQPFTQIDSSLEREYSGTGLGLSLVERFVKLHDGSVEVDSVFGEGSRFTINLPWTRQPTQKVTFEAQTIREVEIQASDKANKPAQLILITDDNPVLLGMMSDYLESLGYGTVKVSSGWELLERVAEIKPDLILIDIQMPGINGMEAIRRTRKHPDAAVAATPIIAVTALAMTGDRERCIEAGANEYISKPVDLRELKETIKKLLEKTSPA